MGGKAPKKMPVCRFFNSAQGCAKGRRCPFRHVPFTGGGGHGGGGRRGAHQLAKRKPAFPKFPSMASLGQALPFAGGTVKITKGKGGRSVTAKQVVKTVQYVKAPGSAPKAPPKPKTVAVLFVLDESGSMSGTKLSTAKGEIVRIVQRVLRPNHYVAVIGFASDVKVYQKPVMKKSIGKGGIQAVVGQCHVRGATCLYDGIDAAIGMVRFHAGSHVMICCLTDGMDTGGRVSFDEIAAKVANPGKANGAKGFFSLTVIGVGGDVDRAKMQALCKPKHAQFIGVGAAGAKDLGAEVRRAFAVVEQRLVRVVTTEVRTVTVSQGRKGGGGGRSKPKGRKPQKGRGRR